MEIFFDLLWMVPLSLGLILATIQVALYFRNRHWKEVLDTIEVGDEYIRRYDGSEPYKSKYGSVVVIEEKMVNRNGEAYVKYRIKGSPFEGSSAFLQTFVEVFGYVPYTGQDK